MSDDTRKKVEEILRDVLAGCINAEEPMQEQAEIECGVEQLLALIAPQPSREREALEVLREGLMVRSGNDADPAFLDGYEAALFDLRDHFAILASKEED